MDLDILFNLRRGAEVVEQVVKQLPNSAGVYKMISADDKALYIGKAKNLPRRVIYYAKTDHLPNRLRRMVSQIDRIEYICTRTEAEALLLEASLIKTQKPIYNICLRDDKSFPFILIDEQHEFPRIAKFRGKKSVKGKYYGPFASAGYVNNAIEELQKLFLVRPCSDSFFASRQRPCLQYEIKRCSAPCVGKISVKEYYERIAQVKNFLSGRSNEVQQQLQIDMLKASDNLDYERAAQLRDRIKILTQIQAKNIFSNSKIIDVDIVAIATNERGNACISVFFVRAAKSYGEKNYYFDGVGQGQESELLETFLGQFYQNNIPPNQIFVNYSLESISAIEEMLSHLANEKIAIKHPKQGNKKDVVDFVYNNAQQSLIKREKESIRNSEIMSGVARLFGIDSELARIEIYDNSHIQGNDSVGCMVVAGRGGFIKDEYRVFNIKTVEQGDDYAMLKEVLRRRLKKVDDASRPDLMLIDGGKGHLSVALEVLSEAKYEDIPLVCIAKGVDRNAGMEVFHTKSMKPFSLPRGDKILHYLQSIRDEVHRFAIETHRKKREKRMKTSAIDDIPGIGAKRKKMLLGHFGSLEALKQAQIEDMMRVSGISKKVAETVFNHCRKGS